MIGFGRRFEVSMVAKKIKKVRLPDSKPAEPTKRKKRKPRTPPAIASVKKSIPTAAEPEPIEYEDIEGLTTKQRVWVEQYLTCWNQTEAARRAGYKDPEVSGWRMKQNVAVKALLNSRMSEQKMSADEVLARLSSHATGSMADFIKDGEGEDSATIGIIDFSKAARAGKLHLIKRISDTDKGTTIELYDAGKALELLGKHYELFSDNKPADRELTVTVKEYNEVLEKVYGERAARRRSNPS